MYNAFPILASVIVVLVATGRSESPFHQGTTLPALQSPTTLQLPAFTAIKASNGSHVVVGPGPAQRVTLIRGSLDYSRVAVERGRLVIDRCMRKCPRGYRLEVEVVAPPLTSVLLSNGGSIESRGSFPRQSTLTVAVDNGGTIDVRSMPADRVTASVNQGGGILTTPHASLSATVSHGGAITYWGDARVTSSVEHGGVVQKGDAGRVNRQ